MWEYNYDNDLYHYGVKGMKWGVIRSARKDAKEFARAKMFYGEGAGTRRKLIKNTVNERSKDPTYKAEFDKALAKQDMAKHAKKATSERNRKDMQKATAKTGRGIVNIVSGHPERVGAGLAGAYGLYKLGEKTGVNKAVGSTLKKTFNEVKKSAQTEYGRRKAAEALKKWTFVD